MFNKDFGAEIDFQLFDRQILRELPEFGEIHDLRLRRGPGGTDNELLIGGQRALGKLAADGSLSVDLLLPSTNMWGRYPLDTVPVYSRDNDLLGILRVSDRRLGDDRSKDYHRYLRPDGSIVWQDSSTVHETIHGDMDRDGKPEFAQVSGSGSNAYVRVYDNEKALLWERKASRDTPIRFVRARTGGASKTVLTMLSGRNLIGYDRAGRQVLRFTPGPVNYYNYAPVISAAPCGPGGGEIDCLLMRLNWDEAGLFSLDGERLLVLPVGPITTHVRMEYWRVEPGRRPLIVVTSASRISGVHLYNRMKKYLLMSVIDQSGRLLFHDRIEDDGGGMAILPPGAFGTPGGIALGGDGKIWLYTPNLERWRQRRG